MENRCIYPTERWLLNILIFQCIQNHAYRRKQKYSVWVPRTILFWFNNWNGCDQTGKQSNSFFQEVSESSSGSSLSALLMSKAPLPDLFLVMWSKRSYFILRNSINSWLSLITPYNPLKWSHSPSVLESDTIYFVIAFQAGKHQWLVLAFHN